MKPAICNVFVLCLLVSIYGGSYEKQQKRGTENKVSSPHTTNLSRLKNELEHDRTIIQYLLSNILASQENKMSSSEHVSKFKSERPIQPPGRQQLLSNGTNRVLSINVSTPVMEDADFKSDTWRFPDNGTAHVSRKRRYNYEDTYDWEEDDNLLEYDVDENSLIQKIGKSWKKVGASLLFIAAGLIAAVIFARLSFVVCKPYIKDACFMTYCPYIHCLYQIYERSCKDDSDCLERDFRTVAEMLGIKLTLQDFQEIREHYGFDGGKNLQDFDSVKSAAKKFDVDVGVPIV